MFYPIQYIVATVLDLFQFIAFGEVQEDQTVIELPLDPNLEDTTEWVDICDGIK